MRWIRMSGVTSFVAVLVVVAAATGCFGAVGVRIKNPSTKTNLVSGHSQTFSGDMLFARHKSADTWVVDYPHVRLEFWWSGEAPTSYLITSTEVGMTFPLADSSSGAWSGALTIVQVLGSVYPYNLFAIPLDPLNSKNIGKSDEARYSVVVSP